MTCIVSRAADKHPGLVRLGGVAAFLNGGTPSRAHAAYFEGTIPWITGADITSSVVTSARTHITEQAIAESATSLVPAGTVLLVTRTSVGKVAVTGVPLAFSQDITAIIHDPDRVDARYLVHFLCTQQPHFERIARGATIKGITRDALESVKLPLGPLDEQRRIAAILDRAEELRAKRRAAIALLDQLPQAIFLEMFGDLDAMERNYGPRPLLQLLYEPMRSGAYFPRNYYTSSGGVEMVHMSDAFYEVVQRGSLRRVNASGSDIAKYQLQPSDLLIARRSLNFDGAAKACRIPLAHEPLIFESSLIRLRPNLNLTDPEFLFSFINHPHVRRKKIEPIITRATISGVSQSNLGSVTVPLPPIDRQRQYASFVHAVRSTRATHQSHLAALDLLFASLQSQAFKP